MRAASLCLLLALPLAVAACHAHGPCGRYLPAADGDTWSFRLQDGVIESARVAVVTTSGATLELRTLDRSGYGPRETWELSCHGEVDLRTASDATGSVIAFHALLPAADAIATGARWRGESRASTVVEIAAPPIRVLDVTTSENRIDREEDVAVAAGTFHALRIESDLRTQRAGAPGSVPSRRIVWLARDVGPVKIENDRALPGGSIESEVAELTGYVVR